MEIIRKSPGKVYYKSNTGVVIKLLAFLAVALVLLVLGVCVFVIFGIGNTKNYFLDASQAFYYSVNKDSRTARFELYVGKTKEYTIPDKIDYQGATYLITEIGAEAFTNNNKLTAVTLSNNVVSITSNTAQKTGAFSGCVKLQTVNLGNNLRHIDNYAFKNCLQLQAVDLPATVQFVGAGAFMNNLALTKIKLNGGNTRLDADSFKFCNRVTTLELSDDVVLDNDKKHSLAMLANLTTFVLSDTNPRYQVADSYLLNVAGDTVVIAGKNDLEPTFTSSITKIEDWAFGERYGSTDIYLPRTVTAVETNAFSSGTIYTDAITKPSAWQTKLPVRCGAEKVTFYRNYAADDTVTVKAYTFTTDPEDDSHYLKQGDTYYPTFRSLFKVTEDNHNFKNWGTVANSECWAEFEDEIKATEEELATLSGVIASAEERLFPGETDTDKQNTRLQFTMAFWEKFKRAYGVAKKAYAGNTESLAYVVKNATGDLQKYLNEFTDPAPSNKVDFTDWRNNLHDFVSVVELAKANRSDFIGGDDVWVGITANTDYAKKCLNDEQCKLENGQAAWRILRISYEKLQANLASDAPLSQLLVSYADLTAENYTSESWEKFTQALAEAQRVTQYNLNVVQVRLALQEAKNNLVENNLATDEQIVELLTWLSVCQDLPEGDYTQSSYDRLTLTWRKVYYQIDSLATVDEVQGALKDLRKDYDTLISLDKKLTDKGDNAFVKSLVPYFIVALVLFTVAIVIQAVASSLKKNQRSKKHE